jgi:hypothetical protein
MAKHGLSDGPLESHNTRKHQQDDKQKNVSFDSKLDSHAETPSSEPKSSSSQRTVRPKAHSYTSGLKFPVVKDPSDPLTILRYSQDEANSSRKDLESSQDLFSFPSGSATELSGETSETQRSSELQSATVMCPVSLDPHLAETMKNCRQSFNFTPNRSLRFFKFASPTSTEVSSTLNEHGRPSVVYQKDIY